jgi:hypothetical protein
MFTQEEKGEIRTSDVHLMRRLVPNRLSYPLGTGTTYIVSATSVLRKNLIDTMFITNLFKKIKDSIGVLM